MRQELRPFFSELSQIVNTPFFPVQRTPVTLISFLGATLFILAAYLISRTIERTLSLKIFPRFKPAEGRQSIKLHLPGAAYGSEIDQVTPLLLQAARPHRQILYHPEPEVTFFAFGGARAESK